jgi:hypothetical protein
MKIKHTELIRKLLTLLALIFFVIFTNQSYALGKLGHKLVCQLAFDHLSQANQQKITDLISIMPKQQRQFVNKYNYQHVNSPVSFAEACTWADAIKKQPEYKQFKTWHYLNVPRDTLLIEHDTCHKNCLTKAIAYHQQQFGTAKLPWAKLQAMMFLGHWLGDIHQPLHVSFASDRGGNKNRIITKDKKCSNLHWLWDECLLYQGKNSKKKTEVFAMLYKKLTQQWQDIEVSNWQQSSIEQWATESLLLTRSPELLYCKINSKNLCISESNRTIRLQNSYYKKHTIVLEQRILKAAVRLTHLIEKSLL